MAWQNAVEPAENHGLYRLTSKNFGLVALADLSTYGAPNRLPDPCVLGSGRHDTGGAVPVVGLSYYYTFLKVDAGRQPSPVK